MTLFISALMRERDELAAALEVRDRIKYDLSSPEREEILSTGDLIIEVTYKSSKRSIQLNIIAGKYSYPPTPLPSMEDVLV